MEGIKRIETMAEGQKDFVLLEVVKYLISRTDMDVKYRNKEKTLKGMAKYIQREILKEICKANNVKEPSKLGQEFNIDGRNVRCVTAGMAEEETYELAINYFNKSNEELGIIPEEKKKKEINSNNKDDEFGSIFEVEAIQQETKKEEVEQISLFSIGG